MYNSIQSNKSIKLVAHDGESVHFLSALLQDGITCGAWILYKNNVLKILINRICLEKSKDLDQYDDYLKRIHSILTIHNILSVKTKYIFKKKIEFYSIVSLICDFDQKKQVHILQILFNKGIIKIEITDFFVTMKDISTNWFSNLLSNSILE